MKTKTICFVAGKSGGHIIPCLTIAENKQLQTNGPINILFFSSDTTLDKAILCQDNRITWHIMLPLSTRAGSLLKTIGNAFISFIRSFFYLIKHRPEEIITTGGIVAIPTCIAGFILRIPIILYSLDAVPGKAIQFLVPIATSITTSFASSQKYFTSAKCRIEQYPVKYKKEFIIDREKAINHLKLSPYKKTIVILGGSQGSIFLNNCMKQFINDTSFNTENIQIIHQTGSLDATDWKSFYEQNKVSAYVFSYMPNLEYIYAAADIIICRAGAGTLFEVKFFNKKCIIIPLETHTTTHQIDNAEAISAEYPELFAVLYQKEIIQNPHSFLKKINQLLRQ